jgi:hypothetical protein
VNLVPTDIACQKSIQLFRRERPNRQSQAISRQRFRPDATLLREYLNRTTVNQQRHYTFHCAVINDRRETVKFLLGYGAGPLRGLFESSKCKFTTALGIAVRHNHFLTKKMLLKALEVRQVTIEWLLLLLPLATQYVNDPSGMIYPQRPLPLKQKRNVPLFLLLRQQHWRFAHPVPRGGRDVTRGSEGVVGEA